MRYLRQFALILGVCLAGEAISLVVPLPVPASVYGLVLMLGLLLSGVVKVRMVKDVAVLLIEYLPLWFIPATVGLIDLWPLPGRLWIAVLASILVITLVVMGVTGHTVQAIQRRQAHSRGAPTGGADGSWEP